MDHDVSQPTWYDDSARAAVLAVYSVCIVGSRAPRTSCLLVLLHTHWPMIAAVGLLRS